jgi:hypothetical protein
MRVSAWYGWAALAIAALLAAAYIASYYSLVERRVWGSSGFNREVEPCYGFRSLDGKEQWGDPDGTWAPTLFTPMYELDRRMRPEYWSWESYQEEQLGAMKRWLEKQPR